MNRNTKLIIGAICVVIGLILFVTARGEMSNSHYTFRPPYTAYEVGVLFRFFIGACLLGSGIVDLIVVFISKSHEDRNMQTPYDGSSSLFSDCPKCGLKMSNSSTKCPKCGVKLKYRNGKLEVDE